MENHEKGWARAATVGSTVHEAPSALTASGTLGQARSQQNALTKCRGARSDGETLRLSCLGAESQVPFNERLNAPADSPCCIFASCLSLAWTLQQKPAFASGSSPGSGNSEGVDPHPATYCVTAARGRWGRPRRAVARRTQSRYTLCLLRS